MPDKKIQIRKSVSKNFFHVYADDKLAFVTSDPAELREKLMHLVEVMK